MTKYIDHENFGMTRTHFNGFIYSVFLCTRSRRACNVSTMGRFELKRDKLRTPASSDTSSARVLALAYRFKLESDELLLLRQQALVVILLNTKTFWILNRYVGR